MDSLKKQLKYTKVEVDILSKQLTRYRKENTELSLKLQDALKSEAYYSALCCDKAIKLQEYEEKLRTYEEALDAMNELIQALQSALETTR